MENRTTQRNPIPFHPDQLLLARAIAQGKRFVRLTSGQVIFIGHR